MDLSAAHDEMRRLSANVDKGVQALADQAKEHADAEHEYRLAKAKAWLVAPDGTVPEREAWVNGQTADARQRRDLAEGLRQAALEAIRSRRTQLSAWQSLLAAHREDVGVGRYGPEVA
jgi:hypothetical protein